MSTNRYDLTFDKDNAIRNAVKLRYVTSAKYGGDWHSTLHSHNCSELFYVTRGVGQFQIEDRLYPVSANDLVIINPNVNHTEVSLNATPLEYIVVGADGIELETPDDSDDHFRIINCQNFKDRILFYMQQMLREIETCAADYETVCQDLMEILVIILQRQTNHSISLTPVRRDSSYLCKTLHRYISAHYKETITLDSLAALTHVSKYHLAHSFTKEYGVSPINYAVSRRIEDARQLLKNDDYTLSMISRTLGFSSQSYFSQVFKKNVGMTPNEYRRQNRK